MQKQVSAKCTDCQGKIIVTGPLDLGVDEYFLPSQATARASGYVYGWCADHHGGFKNREDNSKPQHSKFVVVDGDGVVLGTMRATTDGRDAAFTITHHGIVSELLREIQGGGLEYK